MIPPFDLLLALLLVVVGMWGAGPERAALAIFIICRVATHFLYAPEHHRFQQTELDVFIVDLALLGSLVVLVVVTDRFWPTWMVGIHALTIGGHVMEMTYAKLAPLAYALLTVAPSYLLLGQLAVGVLRHQIRLSKYGYDRSWNSALLSSRRPEP